MGQKRRRGLLETYTIKSPLIINIQGKKKSANALDAAPLLTASGTGIVSVGPANSPWPGPLAVVLAWIDDKMIEASLFSIVNVFFGFIISFGMTRLVLPMFGFYPTRKDSFIITAIFTASALLRNFLVFHGWGYFYG